MMNNFYTIHNFWFYAFLILWFFTGFFLSIDKDADEKKPSIIEIILITIFWPFVFLIGVVFQMRDKLNEMTSDKKRQATNVLIGVPVVLILTAIISYAVYWQKHHDDATPTTTILDEGIPIHYTEKIKIPLNTRIGPGQKIKLYGNGMNTTLVTVDDSAYYQYSYNFSDDHGGGYGINAIEYFEGHSEPDIFYFDSLVKDNLRREKVKKFFVIGWQKINRYQYDQIKKYIQTK